MYLFFVTVNWHQGVVLLQNGEDVFHIPCSVALQITVGEKYFLKFYLVSDN